MKTKKIKKPNIEVLINNLETRQEVWGEYNPAQKSVHPT